MRADRQTAGRGRSGRHWVSDTGNFYASTLLRLNRSDPPAQQLSFVAAVALLQALEPWVEARRMMLKWPNDLFLDEKKLAGILLERHDQAVVAGFGVNLAHHPMDADRPAISLKTAGIDAPSPQLLLQSLAEQWQACVANWRERGFAAIRQAWLARAHPPGTSLVARLSGGEQHRGSFAGLSDDGALQLRLADGSIRAIHAGDVFAL